MVLVTNNWRMWAAGAALSLAMFAVIYFTAIAPSTNAANHALKSGLQQTQLAIKQAQHQLSSASVPSSATAGQAKKQSSQVTGQASKQLSEAAKLTACVTAAGTDTTKLQACNVQYAAH